MGSAGSTVFLFIFISLAVHVQHLTFGSSRSKEKDLYPPQADGPQRKLGLRRWQLGPNGSWKARQPSKSYPLFASSLQNTNGIGFPMAASTTSHGAAARRRWPGRSRAELPHRPPLPSTAAEAPLLAPGCPPQRRGLARPQTRALTRADHVTMPHL